MEFVADFHIHSKYSRATSRDMDVKHLADWAKLKGITLMGTGDFTHHLWLEELKNSLTDTGNGLFKHKDVHFILTSEVSSIYSKNNRTYRIHNLIFAPSFKTVDKINDALGRRGNLASDGRPILGVPADEVARIVFDIDENCMMVPAHCLVPGTLVHTRAGLIPIEDVTRRDRVYTHRARFRAVTKALKRPYEGEVIHIKPYYFREGIVSTPEHPVYVIKTVKNCRARRADCTPNCSQKRNKGCTKDFFENYSPRWVSAQDVEVGDIMVFPRFSNIQKDTRSVRIDAMIGTRVIRSGLDIAYAGTRTSFVHNTIAINKDFCRLAGYYLAEGYTNSRDCVSFCFHRSESDFINDVIALMSKIFGIGLAKKAAKKGCDGVELIFYSKVLCDFFGTVFYFDESSKKAHAKSLPPWMTWLPIEKQVEIIKGWWRGDSGYTSSRILMNQTKAIFLRLGIIPSIRVDAIKDHDRRGKHFIGQRRVYAQHSSYHFSNLSFFEDPCRLLEENEFRKFKTRSITRHGWIDKQYAYLPVRDIEQEFHKGHVYNLEVAEDNSYTCEFACVHNCWTPWFSLFGSMSGFDRIEDCFEKQTDKIFALETGLSSDPAMNWRLSSLDRFTLISNSDSHSPAKIGREANVFNCNLDYKTIRDVLKTKDKKRFLYTIEFFPEEGKYHYDGHRLCNVVFSPEESKQNKGICPKCKRPLTIGVMNRVDQLADRKDGFVPENAIPFKNMVPLAEIIAESKGVKKESVASEKEYFNVVAKFGTEFNILLKASREELTKGLPSRIAEGVLRMREGKVSAQAGYDGEYGRISVFGKDEPQSQAEQQLRLF